MKYPKDIAAIFEEVSHDVKSPLAKLSALIALFSHSSLHSKTEKEKKEHLQKMDDALKRANYAIDLLFLFVFLTKRKKALFRESFLLDSLLEEIIENTNKKVVVKKNGSRFTVYADKELVRFLLKIVLRLHIKENATAIIVLKEQPSSIRITSILKRRKTDFLKDKKGIRKLEQNIIEEVVCLHGGNVVQYEVDKISWELPRKIS